MASDDPGPRFGRALGRGEHELPSPFATGTSVFPGELIRQSGLSEARLQVVSMEAIDPLEMMRQRGNRDLRHYGHTILSALPLPYCQHPLFEIQILDSQSKGFEQSQPSTIEQRADQPMSALEATEDLSDFGLR